MAILDSGAQRRTRKATAVAVTGLPPERLDQILQHVAQARAALAESLGITPAFNETAEPVRAVPALTLVPAHRGPAPAEPLLTLAPTHRAQAPAVGAAAPLSAPV